MILKSYFLNNYFYGNNVDIEIGSLDGTSGKVRFCQFHNNQHFNTIGDVEIRLEDGGALAAPVIKFVIDRMLNNVFFSIGISFSR